jgi:2-succinyl-6-hydroxy-2,4-cyclohexadiene-1-carboxylate synthase
VTPLLLHGFTGSSQSWSQQIIDGLASSGRTPVPVDLPGHGRHIGETDPGRFTLESAFHELEDAAGPDPCPVAGYSMGGRIALNYAVCRRHRVSHLILESASPGLRTAEQRAQRRVADHALADRIERDGVEAFVREWERKPLFESQRALSANVREGQRALRLRNHPGSLAAALRTLGTGALPSCWEDLSGLDLPVLLLTGALDRKFVGIAGDMARLLPRGRLVVVDDAGHAVHLERPDAWLSSVLAFLAEHRVASTDGWS